MCPKTRRPPPEHLIWRITDRCDLSCRHCGSHIPLERPEVLDTAQMLDVAQQVVDLGVRDVLLSGGEPLVRDDWQEIALRLLQGEVNVSLVTNGMTFSPELAFWCAQEGLAPITFSVDGPEAIHDRQRGLTGAYQAVMTAMEHTRSAGLPIVIFTTLTRQNLPVLAELYRVLADARAAVWAVRLAGQRENELEEGDYLQPSDIPELIHTLVDLARQGEGPQVQAGPGIGYYGVCDTLFGNIRGGGWRGCQCGRTKMTIEPDGQIKACGNLPQLEGDLRLEPLSQLWQKDETFKILRQFSIDELEGGCRSCLKAEQCRGGCRAFCREGPTGKRDNVYCYQHPAIGGPRLTEGLWTRLARWMQGA